MTLTNGENSPSTPEAAKPLFRRASREQPDKDLAKELTRKEFEDKSRRLGLKLSNPVEDLAQRHLALGEHLADEAWTEGLDLASLTADKTYLRDLDSVEGRELAEEAKDEKALQGFRGLVLRQLKPDPDSKEDKERWKWSRQHAAAGLGINPAQLERIYLSASKKEEVDLLALSRYQASKESGEEPQALPAVDIAFHKEFKGKEAELTERILEIYQDLAKKFEVRPRIDTLHKIQLGSSLIKLLQSYPTLPGVPRTSSYLRAPLASLLAINARSILIETEPEKVENSLAHELTHSLTNATLTSFKKGNLTEGVAEAGANFIQQPDFQQLQQETRSSPFVERLEHARRFYRRFFEYDGSYSEGKSRGYGEDNALFYRYLLETRGPKTLKDAINTPVVGLNSWHNSIAALERKIGPLPDLVAEAGTSYFGEDAWSALTEAGEKLAFLKGSDKRNNRLARFETWDFQDSAVPAGETVLSLGYRDRTQPENYRARAVLFKDNDKWRYFLLTGGQDSPDLEEVGDIVSFRERFNK